MADPNHQHLYPAFNNIPWEQYGSTFNQAMANYLQQNPVTNAYP